MQCLATTCRKLWFVTGLFLATTYLQAAPNTQPSANQAPVIKTDKGIWNLKDVDIRSVIEQVSKTTNKNFIVDPKVAGKATLISNQPMDKDALYQAFLAMLQVNGYAAVPAGAVIKIVLANDAKQMAVPLVNGQKQVQGDEVVVRVVHADNVQANKLLYILQPLMPQSGQVAVYAPSNSLILSGTAATVEHIANIVARLDTESASQVESVPLRHILADEAVNMLNALNLDSNDKTQPKSLTFVANTQNNSIMLNGDKQSRQKYRQIIRQMDTPNHSLVNATKIVYLHYLKAKDFAPVLAKLLEGTSASASTPSSSPASSDANPSASANTSATAALGPISAGSSTGGTVVQAEPNTNALLIKAAPAMMQNLLNIIKNLDVRPAQVLIEAVIVEVSDSIANQLGINWISRSESKFIDSNNVLNIGFLYANQLQTVIQALAAESNVNILSTPSVVVTNNQEAKIEIGQTVSIKDSSYPNNAGGTTIGTPYTTYTRQKVGLHLYVTPQISQNGIIQMKIDQANDSIDTTDKDSVTSGMPVFNNRTINTNVLIDSGAILVLGGLISNQVNETVNKLPVLGDIPGIGALFQNKAQSRDRKNLMVFLKPVVLKDKQASGIATNKPYEYLRQQQLIQSQKPAYWLPRPSSAKLQPLNSTAELPEPFAK